MRWFRIEPLDVLFFRRPRPFFAGDVSRAEALVHPGALPFVGAFRAEAARALGLSPKDLAGGHPRLGGPSDLGELVFAGPFLEKDGRVFFSFPKAVIAPGKGKTRLLKWLRPEGLPRGVRASLPQGLGLWRRPEEIQGDGEFDSLEADFISEGLLRDLLLHGTAIFDPGEVLREKDFFCIEERVGVGLDPRKRTASEGLLYGLQVVRPREGVAFVLGISGLPQEFPEKGVLPLGGEGRLAKYEERKAPEILTKLPSCQEFEGAGGVLVVLLTPGVFRAGVRPPCFDENWYFRFNGVSGRVIGVYTDKGIALGGFNLATGRPRALVRAVPAGTVWALQFEERLSAEAVEEFLQFFWGQPLAEEVADYPYGKAGFGLAVCGKLPGEELYA